VPVPAGCPSCRSKPKPSKTPAYNLSSPVPVPVNKGNNRKDPPPHQQRRKPENILALTFSDKAAHEMLERLEKSTNTSDLTVSAFHSFALSVLEDNVLES
jgi:hypothetical protein